MVKIYSSLLTETEWTVVQCGDVWQTNCMQLSHQKTSFLIFIVITISKKRPLVKNIYSAVVIWSHIWYGNHLPLTFFSSVFTCWHWVFMQLTCSFIFSLKICQIYQSYRRKFGRYLWLFCGEKKLNLRGSCRYNVCHLLVDITCRALQCFVLSRLSPSVTFKRCFCLWSCRVWISDFKPATAPGSVWGFCLLKESFPCRQVLAQGENCWVTVDKITKCMVYTHLKDY